MAQSKVVTVLGVFAATFCLSGAAPDTATRSGGDVVLEEVNGVKVTMADLEQKRAQALFQARTNYYDAERKVLEDLADQSLLEQQAAKEGVTVEQLLDRHVNATLPKDPSDEALRVYYEGIDTTQPFEAVRGKIIESLRQRRMAKAKAAYLKSLRSQASIIIRLAPPRAPISMKDVAVREVGSPQVTLLEYADYECPYCQQAQPIVAKLEAEFKGKVAFAFKDYPLPMHPHAEKAAEASHCAAAQGKYWEYHDLMFANKDLDVAGLKNDARQLKLDTAAFDTCLDSGQMAGAVKTDASEATDLGIQGTPTFFVNGRSVSGAPSYEGLRAVINEELSAVSNQSTAASAKSAMQGELHDGARSH
ncbi:MAG: thioredoxin domain-containing protein [Bryobacteraceae bacterium]